ncbi:MAG: D-lyxose/D-mannose family sugar isomerase [Muribaculaceae bacterium]|nr:D-lyxose/D-mannose family sugar isomerase [Muribaculaceae bacterium]
MKRSEINRYIREAKVFMSKHQFLLPDWAHWTPADWATKGPECDDIRERAMGWDLTDFGWGDFEKIGLTLVTLRNGSLEKKDKPYCEKIMLVRKDQLTPTHFHWNKTEDIINRGGGVLCMRLWKADKTTEERTDEPITISIDGVKTTVVPGDVVKLNPGQSVCYEPYLYHQFWGEGDHCLVGEVSTVNDDVKDNRFEEPKGRFPQIEEDEAPECLLCNEYPKV